MRERIWPLEHQSHRSLNGPVERVLEAHLVAVNIGGKRPTNLVVLKDWFGVLDGPPICDKHQEFGKLLYLWRHGAVGLSFARSSVASSVDPATLYLLSAEKHKGVATCEKERASRKKMDFCWGGGELGPFHEVRVGTEGSPQEKEEQRSVAHNPGCCSLAGEEPPNL